MIRRQGKAQILPLDCDNSGPEATLPFTHQHDFEQVLNLSKPQFLNSKPNISTSQSTQAKMAKRQEISILCFQNQLWKQIHNQLKMTGLASSLLSHF